MKNQIFEKLNQKLTPLFARAVQEKIFPGAAAGISLPCGTGREFFNIEYGKTTYAEKDAETVEENTFYDLASLTKPLITAMSTLCLVGEGVLGLEQTLPGLLGEGWSKEKEKITVMNLLSHSSGLPAHRPFFYELKKISGNERRKKGLLDLIKKERPTYEPGQKSLYSDLGFMLLGQIIENKSGERLDRFVEKKIYAPLRLEKDIFFPKTHPKNSNNIFAPTEYCHWRKKFIRGGEVSDENCYILGGVCGHAGAFGNVRGVLKMCTALLGAWKNKETILNLSNEHIQSFFKKRSEIKDSTWALGFDTPAKEGSSAGKYISEKSVGHLGFTGTSFWIDPDREIVIVLLSNRVHPSRKNDKIKAFRPIFHNTVIECLNLA